MAELDGSAQAKDPTEMNSAADDTRHDGTVGDDRPADEIDDRESEEEPEEPVAPPRRRLVSELLEGQEVLEESSKAGLQLVAPPVHLEVAEAGQPIYQLDLSAGEPQGEMLEPEHGTGVVASVAAPSPQAVEAGDAAVVPGSRRDLMRQMVVNRDRQVMAAERDGVDAYELAVGVDQFVAELIQIADTHEE